MDGEDAGQAALRRGLGQSAIVSLSVSPKVDDAASRSATFDEVREAYAEQIAALLDGGVDLLMIETVFDTLNAKAALVAASEVAHEPPALDLVHRDRSIGTESLGPDGRGVLDLGEHADPLFVGVNCSLGATEMRPFIEALALVAPTYTSCHPNAGLPNGARASRRGAGRHEPLPARVRGGRAREPCRRVLWDDPGAHARDRPCGRGVPPRRLPERRRLPRFSGLEPFVIDPDTGFVVVGERTNVTLSARFRRLIEADDYQGAVDVALEQVRGGANLLDVNMDADLLDAEQAMTTFLNLLATEPEAARLPLAVWTTARASRRSRLGSSACRARASSTPSR